MTHAILAALLVAGSALADEGPNLEKAIDLPVAAQKLRKHGVPDEEVKEALQAAKDKEVDAGDTAEVLEGADEAVQEHGPIDNFGAFVKEQLEAGKRGQELAAAIKAEHEARGKGPPEGKGRPEGKGPDGKPGGRPDAKPGQGRPDGKTPPNRGGGRPTKPGGGQ